MAIRDCIAAIETPVIEVHISNVATRESFRHESLLTPVCIGLVMGFGLESYRMALSFLPRIEPIQSWAVLEGKLNSHEVHFLIHFQFTSCF